MFSPRYMAAAAVLMFMACFQSAAPAGDCYGGGYGPFGGYYGNWGRSTYPSLDRFAPPYFALYPPVYYSGQVSPRSYGHSPFAYPALPRPVRAPMPQLLWNHFVVPEGEQAAEAEAEVAKLAPRPQWVENPFCAPAVAARN